MNWGRKSLWQNLFFIISYFKFSTDRLYQFEETWTCLGIDWISIRSIPSIDEWTVLLGANLLFCKGDV